MRLIRADCYRILKDRVLYILLAALVAFSVIISYVYHVLDAAGTALAESIILRCVGADTLCTILGIALAMFCGREFEQNTIRNKLSSGTRRSTVFLTKLLENYGISLIFFAVATGAGAVMGRIWFRWEFTEEFWKQLLCQLAIVMGYASMITAICVISKSVKTPVIVTIVLFVVLNPMALFLPAMGDSALIKALSRGVYMVASNMLLAAKDGVYQAVSTSMEDGLMVTKTVE